MFYSKGFDPEEQEHDDLRLQKLNCTEIRKKESHKVCEDKVNRHHLIFYTPSAAVLIRVQPCFGLVCRPGGVPGRRGGKARLCVPRAARRVGAKDEAGDRRLKLHIKTYADLRFQYAPSRFSAQLKNHRKNR